MFSNNRSGFSDRIEKALKPGTLLGLLLIGLAIAYLLGGGSRTDQVTTDSQGEPTEQLVRNDADDPFREDYEDYAETESGHELGNDARSDDIVGQDRGDQDLDGEDSDDSFRETYPETDDGAPSEATGLSEKPVATQDERHLQCIYVKSIRNFHVIDDKHLTVSTSRTRIYLVSLFDRCRQLNWNHKIAIKSFSSWTCSYSRDTIIAGQDRCTIDNIERVASVAQAEELVAERTGKNDQEEDEDPDEDQGGDETGSDIGD
jgi:uncharacterized protein DUF6491